MLSQWPGASGRADSEPSCLCCFSKVRVNLSITVCRRPWWLRRRRSRDCLRRGEHREVPGGWWQGGLGFSCGRDGSCWRDLGVGEPVSGCRHEGGMGGHVPPGTYSSGSVMPTQPPTPGCPHPWGFLTCVHRDSFFPKRNVLWSPVMRIPGQERQ